MREPKVVQVAELPVATPVSGIGISPLFGDQVMMTFITLEANVVLPEHQHANEQIGAVLTGQLELTIAGTPHLILPGMAFYIPPDVPHSAVAGPDGCTTMEAFSPPREAYKLE